MPFAEGASSFLFAALIASILISIFLISLVGDVQEQESTLVGISHLFSVLSLVGLLFGLWLFILGGISVLIISGVFGFFIAFVVVSIAWCNPQRLLKVFPFYFLKVPSFIAIFAIYSVSNIHDSSWGTKEGQLSQETFRSLQSQAYKLQARADKLLGAMFSLLEFAASTAQEGTGPTPGSSAVGGITLDTAIHAAAGLLAKSLHQLTQAQKRQQEDLAKTVIRRSDVDESPRSPIHRNKEGRVQAGQLGGADVQTMQTHRILDRITNLADTDRMIIIESLNVYQAHQAAARRAELAAAKYAIDKKDVAKRFRAFRLMYIAIWLLCNAVIVGVVIGFGLQAEAALGIAGAILFTAGFRVIGSIAFRLQLCCICMNRYCCRRLCRDCCYNQHQPTGRYACCCRKPSSIYHRETLWLREHGLEKDNHPFRYHRDNELIGMALPGNLPAPKAQSGGAPTSPSSAEEGAGGLQPEGHLVTHQAAGAVGGDGKIKTATSMPAALHGPSGLALLTIRTGHSAPVVPDGVSLEDDDVITAASASYRGQWNVFHTHDGYASDNAYDSEETALTDSDSDEEVSDRFHDNSSGAYSSTGLVTPMHGAYRRRRSSGTAFMMAAGNEQGRPSMRGVMTPGRRSTAAASAYTAYSSDSAVHLSKGDHSRPDVFMIRSAADRRVSNGSIVRDHSRQSRAAEERDMADLLFNAENGTLGISARRMPARTVSADPSAPPHTLYTAPSTPAVSISALDTTDHTLLSLDIPAQPNKSTGPLSTNSQSGKPPAYPASGTAFSSSGSPPPRPQRRAISIVAPDALERTRTRSEAGLASSRSRRGSNASAVLSPLGSANSQRRVSWGGISPSTPMSRVAASAFSLAAAIEETEEEGSPARHEAAPHRKDSMSSDTSVKSAMLAHATGEADKARYTLMKNSAADFANPVTRKAYKIVHGRRMSTLRNMKRRTGVAGEVAPAGSAGGAAASAGIAQMAKPARKWQPRDRPSTEQAE